MREIVGIGSGITECLRIARMIQRHGDVFLNRIYSPEEIRFCQTRREVNQHYAARWAAKEAVLRALGTTWRRGINWSEIEIVTDTQGQTRLAFHGDTRRVVEELGVVEVLISLSHCRTHATATAVALRDGSRADADED